MALRNQLLELLDHVKVRVVATRRLVGPLQTDYQPLPWLGIHDARRSAGTVERMAAIRGVVQTRQWSEPVCLDLGCNVGFFSLSFAEMGFHVYSVDSSPPNLLLAQYAKHRVPEGQLYPISMTIKASNVHVLPQANVTLCLSIWHHWVRHYGLESATEILGTIMSKTSDALFFDTGEGEMSEEYGLPFTDENARPWLEDYLSQFGKVECLGRFRAFGPGGDERREETFRHLFVIHPNT